MKATFTFIIIVFVISHLTGYSQNNLVGKKAPDIEIKNWMYPKIQVEDWQVQEFVLFAGIGLIQG